MKAQHAQTAAQGKGASKGSNAKGASKGSPAMPMGGGKDKNYA